MAYYHDLPEKKKKKPGYLNEDWEEEGSRYRNRDKANSSSGTARSSSYKSGGKTGYQGKRSSTDEKYGNANYRKKNGAPQNSRNSERPALTKVSETEVRYVRYGNDPDGPEYQRFEYRTEVSDEVRDNILCGRNPIREALRSGRDIEKLLVQKGELSGSAREIVQEAREKKIMVQEVEKRRLDDIAPHHQGLIAFASAYQYATVDEIIETAAERNEYPFIILLDGVTDPHNLGAVIRTAECAGAHGVIIPQHRSVGLTPAAVKASAGAVEHVKIAKVTNINRTIEDLKRSGIWTYAVTMDGKDYEKVDFHGGTALVIGAEGSGISRLTAEKCDMSVSLPMRGKLDSLNASVAAGIVMYRVLSCRRRS